MTNKLVAKLSEVSKATTVSFSVSETKLSFDNLDDFNLDFGFLKATFALEKKPFDLEKKPLDFPRSIFINADSFKDCSLKETCVVKNHVAYEFAGVRVDEELRIESAVYWASVDVPEILIYVDLKDEVSETNDK